MNDSQGPDLPLATAHLGPAGAALALAALLLGTLHVTAEAAVRRHLDRFAPIDLRQKNVGVLIQREAAAAPGVLPLYGSSELARPSPFRAGDFFAGRPTGFQASPVGARGTPLLVTAQQVGAVGPALAGRKVVLFITPTVFLASDSSAASAAYAGTWSRLQAERTLYDTRLSHDVRQALARRVRAFPEPLASQPLLRFTVDRLAGDQPLDRVGYALALPFGRLELCLLDGLDAGRVLLDLVRRPALRRARGLTGVTPEWSALADSAARMYAPQTGHNPAGFEDRYWERYAPVYQRQRARVDEAAMLAQLTRSTQWDDLDLVLRMLREQQATVLVLGIPMAGQFFDFLGVSPALPRAYYDSLTAHAVRGGARVVTSEVLTRTPNVLKDVVHPSPVGWVAFDQVLDDFYHDRLP